MKILITLFTLLFFLINSATETSPEPRDHHAMTYDSVRKKIVLYGGNGFRVNNKVTFHKEIWEWDGSQWSKPNNGSLQGRSSHVLVFDPSSESTLLFGGVTAEGMAENDVNLWDGSKWSAYTKGPSARYSPAMAYDEKRKALVLFSGSGRGADEMWEWKDKTWTSIKLSEENRPGARARSQMAYDCKRETIILFGGYDGAKSVGDTWEWNGSIWTKLEVKGPEARNNHTMVSDKHRKKIVLFGGKTRQTNTLHGDTWEWDGENWSKLSETGPAPRDMTAATYDDHKEKVLLFGGRDKARNPLGDFWSWNGQHWIKIH